MTTTTNKVSWASKSSRASKNFSEHIVRIENVEIRYFLLEIAPSIQTLHFQNEYDDVTLISNNLNDHIFDLFRIKVYFITVNTNFS